MHELFALLLSNIKEYYTANSNIMAALHWCWTFKILKGLGGLFWILECVRRVTSVKIYSLHQIPMLIFPESRTKAQTEREAMAMYDMTA